MSSTNFVTVKSHLSDFKSNSDTVSETSESGTSNSVTSAEELQKFALILGLNSAEDVYQERFRVDRRRLERMLADNLDEWQTAQAFFHRVQTDTQTLIKWPTRLKIGARSKKDPHVRVAGRMENVKLARDKIMQLLDTRSNRVAMKIDVSYTDHSHIIGKGGLTIKRVMDDTGCHIHFPDSNRSSALEKSNQVSISGDIEGVERARARVRALTPLIFCFELPIVAPSKPLPDLTSPYVKQIQEQYNVQVMMRNRAKLHANLLVVKGVQWEVQATMEATNLLMKYMCGHLASQTQVQMTLEISPIHHSVVLGRGAEQLKIIMKGTNTQIMFPDADDPNIPAIKKSCVTITGQIKDVYAARQQLVGSLPVVLIFDVPEHVCRGEAEADRIMQMHSVYINLRRKPKQGIVSVVIKGIERCAGDLYEARRALLTGKEPVINAEVPESYNIPSMGNVMPNFGGFNPFSPQHNNSPCNPLNSPFTLNELANFAGSPLFPQPPTPGGYPSPLSPATMTPPVFPNRWLIPSPQPRAGPFQYPNITVPNPNIYGKGQGWNPMVSSNDSGSMQPPMMLQPQYQHQDMNMRPQTLSQILNASAAPSSGYQSNFTGSCMSLDTHNNSGGNGSSMASPSVSPISKDHSPMAGKADTDHSTNGSNELATIISDLTLSDRRAVGCEKKTLESLGKLSPLSEYRRMKAEASKAMQESVGSGFRIPTPRWSGYYFSNTSPGPLSLDNKGETTNTTPEKPWPRPDLVRPNIASPHQSPPAGNKPCRYQQLYNLLRDIGLQKYIELFRKHELDMSTFASLNDADLTELGVSAFGARRKMLLVIAELQKQNSGFQRAASSADGKIFNSPKYNVEALSEDKIW